MKRKILLKDVKKLEAEYGSAIINWGENNQITLRAMVKYYELKKEYEEGKEIINGQ